MILGTYISLGDFLLIAARNPRQHRSLILSLAGRRLLMTAS
jgi:hypothetical protein